MESFKRMEQAVENGLEPSALSYLTDKKTRKILEEYRLSSDMVRQLEHLGKQGKRACEAAGLIFWGPVARLVAGAQEQAEEGFIISHEPAGDIHWCPLSSVTSKGGWQLSDGENLWDIPLEWVKQKLN